jgi:uncharacterized protein (TIGR02246 family)
LQLVSTNYYQDIQQSVNKNGPAAVSIAFAEAVSAGDIDAAAASFADDACLFSANGGEVCGRDRIRGVLEQLLSNRPKMEVAVERVVERDGIAVAAERWRMWLEAPDGTKSEQSGASTVVLRQDDAAGWQLLIDAPWGL